MTQREYDALKLWAKAQRENRRNRRQVQQEKDVYDDVSKAFTWIYSRIHYLFNHYSSSSYGSGNGIRSYRTDLSFMGITNQAPFPKNAFLGVGILILMGLVYGYAAYHLIHMMQASNSFLPYLLASQGLTSAFILFVFYCVIMEEEEVHFPYLTLFSESWQLILKVLLGQFLVYLTWGLFF